jgi:CpeT protein
MAAGFALALAMGLADASVAPAADEIAAARLAHWLAGSFSSQEQSLADSAFLDIRLHTVRIWDDRADGFWLYVEQATASHQDHPYRQRVYRIRQLSDSTVESAVFELPYPEVFVGSWSNPVRFAELDADSLLVRQGCSIHLRLQGDSAFVGSTQGRTCASTLRGASYATSVVMVTDSVMVSWDRGWDQQGNQVWGAVSGGYIFRKLEASSSRPEQAP